MAWTRQDIDRLDRRYAEEDIPLHLRPLKAAQDLLGSSFQLGSKAGADVRDIQKTYEELFPEVRTTWPGSMIGICASSDRVKKVTFGIIFGEPTVPLWQGLGFSSNEEWSTWCRQDDLIAAGTALSFADIYDLMHGGGVLQSVSASAAERWRMATGYLEDVANTLPMASHVDAVLQPVSLVAELACKAALLHLGVPDRELSSRPYGHDVPALVRRLAAERPYRDDELVIKVAEQLPPFVSSRYEAARLSRLQVVRLAVGAQFVAASVARRLSNEEELTLQMERQVGPVRSKVLLG
ncbi:hypothetical protein ACWKW4_13800 [Hydrogenophaga borbori]